MASLIDALLVVAALYVYLSVARQIAARPDDATFPGGRRFGIPEAIAAIFLAGWFILNIIATSRIEQPVFRTRDLIITAGFSFAVLLILTTLLRLRGFKVIALGGFSRLSFGRIVSTAAVLLFAAYPLLFAADGISNLVLGGGSSPQQIVQMFTGSETLRQRVMIIILAITVAPFSEEFIFRFFLYGVCRRYFGRSFGLLATSILFGAVHVHLPSFLPLFVLGGCLTLAYEWSGSILVSMTMHALFNCFALSALAFPNLLPQ